MNETTKALLEQYDEKGQFEFPSDFAADLLERRARRVYDALLAVSIGCELETWIHNQDASFGLAIVLTEFEQNATGYTFRPTIRFSNFGSLASITSTDGIPSSAIDKITTLLQENEFSYLPAVELDAEYDGTNSSDASIPTWWIRYFDYL